MITNQERARRMNNPRGAMHAGLGRLGRILMTVVALATSGGMGLWAAEAPLTQRFALTTLGDIALVGNAIVTCDTADPGCVTALTSGQPSNTWTMFHVDVDADGSTFNSSSADLSVPAGATVLFAGLYWAGTTEGSIAPPNVAQRANVRFETPVSGGYVAVAGAVLGDTTAVDDSYAGFADVTALVQAGGAGTYTVADIQVTTGTGITGPWGGWAIAVAYQDPAASCNNLNIYDGYENFFFASESVNISGFETPAVGPVSATLGFFMGDGDRQNVNPDDATDALIFAGTTLSNALSPATNFFNNTISTFGANNTARSPNPVHSLVVDVDVVDADGVLAPGSTSATVTLNSDEGLWWPMMTASIGAICPELTIAKTASPSGIVVPGAIIDYTIVVENTGVTTAHDVTVTDTLPAGVSYVPGSSSATYWIDQSAPQSGSYTSPNLGPSSFDLAGITLSLNTAGLIPAGATLASYGMTVTGNSIDWLSDIGLTATYPGGTAYTLPAGTFGGNGPGTFNQTRGPGAFGGAAEGVYQFIWTDGFDGAGGNDNTVDSATFTIGYDFSTLIRGQVTNPGGAPPGLVTTTVPEAAGIDLEPGETMTVTLQVTVDNPPPGGTTQYVNTAETSALGLPPVTDTATNSLDGADADVAITKNLLTPGIYVAGQQVTYSVVVTNNGPVVATNVVVTDTPSNVTIQSVSSTNCSAFPCTIPSLGIGASETITVVGVVNAVGVFENAVTVTADEPDIDLTNNADQTSHVAGNTVLDCQFDNIAFITADQADPDGTNNQDRYGNSGSTCAAIEGTVWLDDDGDGVLDIGEAGIGAVTVFLCAAGVSPCNAGNAITTAETDATGGYSFSNLPAGDYQVQVAPADLELDGLQEAPGNVAGGSGTIELEAGEVERADFGYVPAIGTAVVDGTVWSDADQDGVQDPGEVGIPGVSVQLFNTDGTPALDGGGQPITAVTGPDGSYLLTDIPPGEYVVRPDTADLELIAFCAPTTIGACNTTPVASVPLTVEVGDAISNIDFGFDTSASYAISDMVWLDSDDDGVFDSGEAPIPGVSIDLIDCGTGTCDDGDEAVTATAVTDAAGEVEFTGVPDGDYQLSVSDNAGELTALLETTGTGGTQAVTVAGGDEFSAPSDGGTPSFGYNAPGTIGDRIWSDADGDGMQDPDEAGIGGVVIELLADTDGDGTPDTVVATTTTVADGSYRFDGLEPGDYTVRVAATNFLPGGALVGATQTFDADGAGSADQSTTSLAGFGSDPNQDFGYQNPALADVSGTVFFDTDADGLEEAGEVGIAEVTVSLVRTYQVINGRLDVNGDGVVNSADDGVIDGVSFINGRPDLNGDGATNGGDDGTFKGVTVINGRLDMNGDGSVNVANRPLDDGMVICGPIATATTDGNGDYTFPDLPDGSYQVQVTDDADVLDGHQLTSGLDALDVTVAGVDVMDVDFGYVDEGDTGSIGDVLWLDADRDGVRDAGEPGLAGVTVEVFDAGPDGVIGGGDDVLVGTVTTDANGGYVLDGLPPGNYYVSVDTATLPAGLTETTYPMGVDPSAVIALSEGEDFNDADFGFVSAAGSALGDTVWYDADGDGVQDPGEAGILGVEVTVDGPSGPITVTTGPDGSWLVPGLAPGLYGVTVDVSTLPAGYNPAPTNADVSYLLDVMAGTDYYHLDWGFNGGTTGSIGDTVFFDADGDGIQDPGEGGIEGVTINLLDDLGNVIATTTTAADGSYDFVGLPARDYTLEVTDVGGVLSGLNVSTPPVGTVMLAAGEDYDLADYGYAPSGGTGSIGSQVWRDADGDGVLDAGESGIQGVTIDLWHNVDSDGVITPGIDNLLRTVTTDANGEYELNGLPADDYIVQVTDTAGVLTGFTHTLGTPGVDGNSQPEIYPLTLTPGIPNNPTADFGYFLASGLSISGTVFEDEDESGSHDEPGEPVVPGVTVNLYRVVGGSPVLIGTTTTDAFGDYSFDDLPDGDYVVEVLTDGTPVDGFDQTTQNATGGVQLVTLAGSDSTDNDFGFFDSGLVTNPVTLASFHADGTTFEWTTATESGNVGFNLWHYDHAIGMWLVLNDALVPSTAVYSASVQRYAYDGGRAFAGPFVVEDVDIRGRSRFHGPFELGRRYGHEVSAEPIPWDVVLTAHETAVLARAFDKSGSDPRTAELRLSTTGLYRVTYEQLLAADVDLLGVPADELALLSPQGPEPVRVEGPGATFGPGGFVEWVGNGLDTLYARTNVYRLIHNPSQALRPVRDDRPVDLVAAAPDHYLETVRVGEDQQYSFGAPNGDPWYDAGLVAISSSVARDYSFALPEWVPGAAPVELTVDLWGVTDFPEAPDHHAVVSVNGFDVVEASFDGLVSQTLQATLAGVAGDGSDVLEIRLPHDTGAQFDLVNVEGFGVTYPRALVARDGYLRFAAAANVLEVRGLATPMVEVYRLEDGTATRITQIESLPETDGYRVRFNGTSDLATYVVAEEGALRTPDVQAGRAAVDLLDTPAELLIIAHSDFIAGIEPLATARRGEGMSVRVVDLEDVLASYSGGTVTAEAIHAYVVDAHAQMDTRYVLLVGADSYDYLDHLGLGAISFVPTLYGATDDIVSFAPIDARFGDVNGDDVPEVAIGRLPVRTVDELADVVAKTLAYPAMAAEQTAVFAADAYDAANDHSFSIDSDVAAQSMPTGWQLTRAYIDELGVAGAKAALVDTLDAGVALASFFGHSGPTSWSFSGLFTANNAAALLNAGRPTVVTQWGCWNTYYVSPQNETMGHKLMTSGNQGAVAALGASTLTTAETEQALALHLVPRLFQPGQTLGSAVLGAKQALAADGGTDGRLDVLLGWNLLGDPTLRLVGDAPVLPFEDGFESGDTSAWTVVVP